MVELFLSKDAVSILIPVLPLKKIRFIYLILHVIILPSCIYVHHTYAVLTEARKWQQFPWTQVRDGCELPRVCREQNPGPLQEQWVCLTTEPPSQFLILVLKNKVICVA